MEPQPIPFQVLLLLPHETANKICNLSTCYRGDYWWQRAQRDIDSNLSKKEFIVPKITGYVRYMQLISPWRSPLATVLRDIIAGRKLSIDLKDVKEQSYANRLLFFLIGRHAPLDRIGLYLGPYKGTHDRDSLIKDSCILQGVLAAGVLSQLPKYISQKYSDLAADGFLSKEALSLTLAAIIIDRIDLVAKIAPGTIAPGHLAKMLFVAIGYCRDIKYLLQQGAGINELDFYDLIDAVDSYSAEFVQRVVDYIPEFDFCLLVEAASCDCLFLFRAIVGKIKPEQHSEREIKALFEPLYAVPDAEFYMKLLLDHQLITPKILGNLYNP